MRSFLQILSLSVIFLHALSASAQKSPGFDSTRAIKEINARNIVYLEALSTGDSVALGDFYTIDAKIYNDNSPTTVGRAQVVSFYSYIIRMGIRSAAIKTESVFGTSNDQFIEEGRIEFKNLNGVTQIKAKYMLVWKREGGVLKIMRDGVWGNAR